MGNAVSPKSGNPISQEIISWKSGIDELKNNEKKEFSVERAELSDAFEFGKIGELIQTLFDKNTGNDLIEAEKAITDALAEVSNKDEAVEFWLVKELKGRFGLKLKVENHIFVIEGDETDKLSKEDFAIPHKLLEIPNKLRDPKYSFDEFYDDLSSLKFLKKSYAKTFNKLSKQMGIKIEGNSFSEKIDNVLKHEKLEDAFNKLKEIELNKGTELDKVGKKLGMVLLKEQRDLLNVVPGLDVESFLNSTEVGGDMEKFKEKFSLKVYVELQKWYKSQSPKLAQKTVKPKNNFSAEKVDGVIKGNFQKLEMFVLGGAELPLVVKKFFSEAQVDSLQIKAKKGEAFSFSLEDVKTKVSNTLEGLTDKHVFSGFNNTLNKINTKDKAQFMLKKMATISYAYRDSERVDAYIKHIKKLGPAALDFPDWIITQEIPTEERMGAAFKNLFEPFLDLLKIISDFSGDKKNEEEKTKTGDKIAEYTAQVKQYELTEKEQVKQDAKIQELINSPDIIWKDININGLGKEKGVNPTLIQVRNMLGKDNFEVNFENLKSVVTSKDNGMPLALKKNLEFSTLQKLNDFNVEGVTIKGEESGDGKTDKLVFTKKGEISVEFEFNDETTDQNFNDFLKPFLTQQIAADTIKGQVEQFELSKLKAKDQTLLLARLEKDVQFPENMDELFIKEGGIIKGLKPKFKNFLNLDEITEKKVWGVVKLDNAKLKKLNLAFKNLLEDDEDVISDVSVGFEEFKIAVKGHKFDKGFENVSEFFKWIDEEANK